MLGKNSYITNQIQEERQVSFMCHRIFPQMSHITKKLYWAKKTNVKNDMSLSYLLRRFPAMNNVRQWNVTLNMYQSDEVFLCCRHSYLRLLLFYVHRFNHFPSISFLRHFYHQDTKYDMSPKVNNFLHTTYFRLSLFSSVWNLIHSSEESFGGVWGWVRFLTQNKFQHILSELRRNKINFLVEWCKHWLL